MIKLSKRPEKSLIDFVENQPINDELFKWNEYKTPYSLANHDLKVESVTDFHKT